MAEKSGSKKTGSPTSGANNNDKTTGGQSTRLRTDVVLPQTKVKTIMKSSPEIESIGADSVLLITKATVSNHDWDIKDINSIPFWLEEF